MFEIGTHYQHKNMRDVNFQVLQKEVISHEHRGKEKKVPIYQLKVMWYTEVHPISVDVVVVTDSENYAEYGYKG